MQTNPACNKSYFFRELAECVEGGGALISGKVDNVGRSEKIFLDCGIIKEGDLDLQGILFSLFLW